MGVQVTSLSMGGAVYVEPQAEIQQERRQEKQRPSLPIEKKEAAKEVELYPKDAQKTQAPDLERTAAELEHISHAFNRRLKFVIDQDSREVIIKVIDNETDKVIRVLPPEELQRLHNRISETIGFLFDRMV